MKVLKLWNGRNCSNDRNITHVNIAAYSKKQASELLALSLKVGYNTYSEINNYYSNCWGNTMNGIVPDKPCVYFETKDKGLIKVI